jgi:hypothetical protein
MPIPQDSTGSKLTHQFRITLTSELMPTLMDGPRLRPSS